ncbi:uncharacterized protein LOC126162844 [Schistocerca cancellata]|uniref:uncharacterized protein LOC126162844 n=1 Tax=Schistocerca cancellata TaxID=274614 RepID=UPI0021196B36|nr:uncharacterized protein LOC126162844 [Schistocerca cancellata]
MKKLSEYGVFSSLLDCEIEKNLWVTDLHRYGNNSKHGVIIDLTCEKGETFLKSVLKNDSFGYCGAHWFCMVKEQSNLSFFSKNDFLMSATALNISEVNFQCTANISHREHSFTTEVSETALSHKDACSFLDMRLNKSLVGNLSYKINVYDIRGDSNYKYSARGTVVRTDSNFQMDMSRNRELFDRSILHLLQDILEFRLKVSNHDGKKYSRDLSILRQLATNKIDVGSTTILLTYDRIGMADYSIGVDTFKPQLFYKVQSLRAARNIYSLPFSLDVWVSLFSLLVGITFLLTFILGSETRLPIAQKNSTGENFPFTGINASRKQFSLNMLEQPSWDLSEVMLVTIGALSQQGADRHPNTMAARILFLVLFLLAVLMYTAYSASVISIMSSTKPVSNSLQGILESSSKMSVALHDIHYYHTQFQIERNPLSQNLHKLELVPEFLSLEEGLEGALEGTIAFSCGQVDAHTYLQNSQHSEESLCGLGEIPVVSGVGYQRSFALRHNSPLRKAFDKGLLRLMEHGLVKREWHRYFGKRPASELHCEEASSSTGFVRITLDDVWPAVKMFGVGLTIAILLLPTELLVRQCTRYMQRKSAEQYIEEVTSNDWSFRNNGRRSSHQVKTFWNKLNTLMPTTKTELPFIH